MVPKKKVTQRCRTGLVWSPVCLAAAAGGAQKPEQSYQSTDGSFLVQVDLFNVNGKANTTGTFVMEVHPSWAPFAVARYVVVRTGSALLPDIASKRSCNSVDRDYPCVLAQAVILAYCQLFV